MSAVRDTIAALLSLTTTEAAWGVLTVAVYPGQRAAVDDFLNRENEVSA